MRGMNSPLKFKFLKGDEDEVDEHKLLGSQNKASELYTSPKRRTF